MTDLGSLFAELKRHNSVRAAVFRAEDRISEL
jgi:hypothetical protein